MNILVVDDEQPARERLIGLLQNLDCQVCGEASNGLEALQLAQDTNPDVVLMDIRMPHMDGLEAAQHLARLDTPPALIFTTAYDDYALAAFETQATAYLLKPVRKEHLHHALAKASSLNRAQLASLGQAQEQTETAVRSHFCVKIGNRLELIPLDEAYYFQAEQKYVTLRHRQGEAVLEESLKALETEFSQRFLRIHRNALVAIAQLAGIEKNSQGRFEIVFRDIEDRLEISRRHLPQARRCVQSL